LCRRRVIGTRCSARPTRVATGGAALADTGAGAGVAGVLAAAAKRSAFEARPLRAAALTVDAARCCSSATRRAAGPSLGRDSAAAGATAAAAFGVALLDALATGLSAV